MAVKAPSDISGLCSSNTLIVITCNLKTERVTDATLSCCIFLSLQVAICGGCDVYRPWGACIVGLIAGIGYNFTSWWMVKLKIDDPVDAVAGLFLICIFHIECNTFKNVHLAETINPCSLSSGRLSNHDAYLFIYPAFLCNLYNSSFQVL